MGSPTVYLKKKNDKISDGPDFFTGLNDCLETYDYSLSEASLQIPVDEECTKDLTTTKQKVCIDLTECHLE